jgi:sulfide:quinone oxidoreductase
MTTTAEHQILIVGGGTAGITVAARMLRKGYTDVAVIEPSNMHYYQPLWTLVGGGQAKASARRLRQLGRAETLDTHRRCARSRPVAPGG